MPYRFTLPGRKIPRPIDPPPARAAFPDLQPVPGRPGNRAPRSASAPVPAPRRALVASPPGYLPAAGTAVRQRTRDLPLSGSRPVAAGRNLARRRKHIGENEAVPLHDLPGFYIDGTGETGRVVGEGVEFAVFAAAVD